MRPPELPNERERLSALDATDLFYSPAEERFDRITRLASHVLEVPIALVTLIGEKDQWFKSVQGLASNETPREVSFCAHAIAAGDALVVEDAAQDQRFADNPLVTGDPHVRAYAGTVIHAPGGEPLGTLCVIDRKPRKFSDAELARLADLAAIAEAEIARGGDGPQADYLRGLDPRERRERIDPQSRLLGHEAIVEILMREAGDGAAPSSVILVRIPQLAGLESRVGADGAAQAMRGVTAVMLRALPESDVAARFADDTFIVLARGAGEDTAVERATRLCHAIASTPVQAGPISVRLTAKSASRSTLQGNLAERLQSAADEVGAATSR